MPSRPEMIAAVLAFTLLGLAGRAEAASFDCGKAVAPDEIAICGNTALSELDTEMSALWFSYSRIPMLMGSSGARQDDAHAFLEQRTACGSDLACLTTLYRGRIATLKEQITEALSHLSP